MQKNYQTPSLQMLEMTSIDIVRTSTQVDKETGDHIQWWEED